MGIFFKRKKKEDLMLVFNIGSSSVVAALFVPQKSGVPKIVYSTREPIPIEEDATIDRFLFLATQSLDTVAKKILMTGLGVPKQIFCVLSSQFYVSQTRIISFKKNTPFVFNVKFADSLIQKEIKIFQEENRLKYASIDGGVRTIELKNIKTMLNGYDAPNPLYQKAKELEMVIFVSMSAEQVLRKIENTVKKYFHFEQMKFSSFAMAFFTAVRDVYKQQENFLLVDIGGEVTDIFMTKKNILRESISFPLGRNFLTRGVASELKCSLNEANSLISLYKDGHAEKLIAKKLAVIMKKLQTKWLEKFQESLANLSHDISIPSTIYIAIDKDLADFFSETIKSEQFSQYTLAESKFEVIFLSTELLHGIATFKDSVVREPFIIIDSIYINRFLIET